MAIGIAIHEQPHLLTMRDTMDISILIVCNEQHTLDALNRELTDSGYTILLENDIMKAAEYSPEKGKSSIALLYISPANVKSILTLLELMRHKNPDTACIIISAINDSAITSEFLRKGAAIVLTAPHTREKIIGAISDVAQTSAQKKNFIRILILEDDQVSAKLLTSYLESYGPCDHVTDGRHAVELFREAIRTDDRYHLIFVDIMVPEIQGHDVLRLIRETEQKAGIPIEQKAKIIMTTSLSDAENIIEAFKATCDSYLIKPIRKAKLINEIESLGLVC
jgi:two-component system, chemotaxis family, chemotaxis protein CheY